MILLILPTFSTREGVCLSNFSKSVCGLHPSSTLKLFFENLWTYNSLRATPIWRNYSTFLLTTAGNAIFLYYRITLPTVNIGFIRFSIIQLNINYALQNFKNPQNCYTLYRD